MKIIDAPPPKDFPTEVIVLDNALAERHLDKGFYLRVQVSEREVTIVRLDGHSTLPGAREMAKSLGFNRTHVLEHAQLTAMEWKSQRRLAQTAFG